LDGLTVLFASLDRFSSKSEIVVESEMDDCVDLLDCFLEKLEI
jgi:hypothetical protein